MSVAMYPYSPIDIFDCVTVDMQLQITLGLLEVRSKIRNPQAGYIPILVILAEGTLGRVVSPGCLCTRVVS